MQVINLKAPGYGGFFYGKSKSKKEQLKSQSFGSIRSYEPSVLTRHRCLLNLFIPKA